MGYVFSGVADVAIEQGRRSVVDQPRSAPCRRCLRDAEPGEEVVLVSYDPFTVDSPYRGAGPVFVHAAGCAPYRGREVPAQQRVRLLSVRAFDASAMMIDSDVVDGRALEPLLEQYFADAATAFVHVHNAKPGCFAVRVDRG